jgi:RecA/RadA recombinase
MFEFEPATKAQAKARIALDGPSGSGKTWTSLVIATTLGERVAVIDTEHGSASKYADQFAFNRLNLTNYDPRVLVKALAAAGAQGYDVVIVDSLSHFWMGAGGMLEQVDHAAKRSGGHGMSGWKEMRPYERQMVDALLAYPGHVIVTMRVKTDWVEGENSRGKRQMIKVGTKAEQREGIEYEFDIVGSLDLDNELNVTKSRCPAVSGAIIPKPGRDFAETIKTWLDDGVAGGPSVSDLVEKAVDSYATRADLLALYKRVEQLGLLAAPVMDDTGEPTILGELIKAKGREAAGREVAA